MKGSIPGGARQTARGRVHMRVHGEDERWISCEKEDRGCERVRKYGFTVYYERPRTVGKYRTCRACATWRARDEHLHLRRVVTAVGTKRGQKRESLFASWHIPSPASAPRPMSCAKRPAADLHHHVRVARYRSCDVRARQPPPATVGGARSRRCNIAPECVNEHRRQLMVVAVGRARRTN